jgi:hypothetical protein
MKNSLLFLVIYLIFIFFSCQHENQNIKQTFYSQLDTLYLNGHKFSKKEFNAIVDNFPRLFQADVLHPDSLYSLELKTNPNFTKSYGESVSFDCEAGQDRFFALYAYFMQKRRFSAIYSGFKYLVRLSGSISLF